MRSVALFRFAFLVPGILTQNSASLNRHQGHRTSSSFRHSAFTKSAKTHVLQHSTRSKVIITPSLPIKYNKIKYYWYGNYVYDAGHPSKCEYHIDETDREFRNVTFPDGSKPPSLQFGCLTYEDCCGLECCGDSRSSTWTICGIFLIILGLYSCFQKYSNYTRDKRNSIASSTIISTRTFANQNVQTLSV
ncbi:CX domain-containing protein [Caenorhabditis elegans]|uniref:CX domain-containing protein n=1 Tax=Caenorhabditis elegans TaxID=6239 RepID=Q19664_CAEEL|nr:CX domain-containing protein [Caenorhabditis elegans]CCD61437.2 CX domain-containing protein [Caenorhabditis elegans]|eukprot:NP_001350969.1 Uncharacterized protein CELE_F21C10.6 [Caenorhabditis elegans]